MSLCLINFSFNNSLILIFVLEYGWVFRGGGFIIFFFCENDNS